METTPPRHEAQNDQIRNQPPRWTSRNERKGQIAQAAVRLIERSGGRALRSRGLASEAGISVGSLFRLFETMEEVILHAASAQFERPDRPICSAEDLVIWTREMANSRPAFFQAVVEALQVGRARGMEDAFVYGEGIARCFTLGPESDGASAEALSARMLTALWHDLLSEWAAGRLSIDEVERQLRAGLAAADKTSVGFGQLPGESDAAVQRMTEGVSRRSTVG